jgi:hypothetical protein
VGYIDSTYTQTVMSVPVSRLEKTTGLGKLKKLDVSMDAESTKKKYHQKVGSMENWGMVESGEGRE